MFITTTLISLQIPLVKGYHWSLGVAFFAFFGFLDGKSAWLGRVYVLG
jgi:hypothetical protein